MQIVYTERYSDTIQPDKHGRWARKCFYKELCIAWISRLETESGVGYWIDTYFPTTANDLPCYTGVEHTYEEAQEKLQSLWANFLNEIS